ncbi:MAG: hypothetical protein JWQ09_3561 [Segetibacter sp.]|nr:hypothetical protein [Segetibacter sp.]
MIQMTAQFNVVIKVLQLNFFPATSEGFEVKGCRLFYELNYSTQQDSAKRVIYLPDYLAKNSFQTLAHLVYCLSFYYSRKNVRLFSNYLKEFGIEQYQQYPGITITNKFYKTISSHSFVFKFSQTITKFVH